jgi:hypothetical protein
MNQQKIDQAVDWCLQRVSDKERPFRQLADFLMALKTAGWPEEEVMAVQSRIIEGLSRRPDGDSCA